MAESKKKVIHENETKEGTQEPIWLCALQYGFVILTICLAMYHIFGLSGADLVHYPITVQSGDAATGMATAKSMLDHGWIYENPNIGAPGIYTGYDATTMELILSMIEQILIWVTKNWILSYNLFYLLGYVLCGITALYALKQLKITGWIAAPTAVLYAFLPYHQLRGLGHMYLGMYFMVPIMVLFLIRLMSGEILFERGKKGFLKVKNLLHLLLLVLMALTGIYYAFFFCFFLCVVILYELCNRRNWQVIRQSLFAVGTVVATLVVAAIPNLLFWQANGRAISPPKGAEGAEYFGLKIIQLLLPASFHRLTILHRLRNMYDTAFPLVTENGTASLGIYMSIGFLALCLCLFAYKRIKEKPYIQSAMLLNLAAVLFGTIGGFGAMFSILVPDIRCYNRISVFIAMFALFASDNIAMYFYERWFQKRLWKRILVGLVALGVMACGLYDQSTPINPASYQAYRAEYEDMDRLVKAMESTEAEGAMIYQMPYMRYPENGAIHEMADYQHLSCYLHTNKLRFSYGAPSGREVDAWFQELNAMPMDQQIWTIKDAGFAGIYIDWNAYLPDERTAIEAIFASAFEKEPIYNNDQTRAYYSFGY